MATLTSEYQYLGRSSAMVSNGGTLNYYLLLYGRTTANSITGYHHVQIKSVLASINTNAMFYEYATSFNGKVAGANAFSGTNMPWAEWELEPFTEGGVTYKTGTVIGEGTVAVDCTDGASKDVTLSVYWKFTGSSSASYMVASGTSRTVSQTVTLSALARATTISSVSCNSLYLTGNISVNYTAQSASMYNRLYIYHNDGGTLQQLIRRDIGNESSGTHVATFYLGDSLNLVYNAVTDDNKATLRVVARTYADSSYSTQVGNDDYREITLYIPETETTKPVISITSVAPVHVLDSTFSGVFVQGYSKAKATFTAEGQYGASIVSAYMTVEGDVYESTDDYTSVFLYNSGDVKVSITARDSRGFTNTVTQTIYVAPYSAPKIVAAADERDIICARCDAEGNLSDTGTYLKIKVRRSYSKVISGEQKNFCAIRYRYQDASAESYGEWTPLLEASYLDSDEIESAPLLDGTLNIKSSYNVQIGVIDSIGSQSSTTRNVPTEEVYMHRGKNALAIGKYIEEDYLIDIASTWDVRVLGSLILATDDGGAPIADFVVSSGEADGWTYTIWKSGVYELRGTHTVTTTEAGTLLSNMFYSEEFTVPTPFAVANAVVLGTASDWFIPIYGGLSSTAGNNGIGFRVYHPNSFATGVSIDVSLYVRGTILK